MWRRSDDGVYVNALIRMWYFLHVLRKGGELGSDGIKEASGRKERLN